MRETILIVDDDPSLREVVRFALEREGFQTLQAGDGRQALELFAEHAPALVVLDIVMPELDGTEVCREIRRSSSAPIVFLSSRDEELDRILGLELGGDDYVTKPFSPRELVARVRAILRRSAPAGASRGGGAAGAPEPETEQLRCGGLTLDLVACAARWEQREVVLTAMEFALLRTLMRRPRKVFTREELIRLTWDGAVVSDRTVDSHIRRIRRKFGAWGCDPIETATGFGYRMAPL
jgi:two-component system OmpR family response regulator